MEDIILYHGSRGGIEGDIMPISRSRCDFGSGFYMGTNSEQTKGLIIRDVSPIFYTLKLHLSEIPENRILKLNDYDWIYTVLAHRKRIEEFNNTSLAKEWIQKLENCDIVYGPIADDRMNEAMKAFSEYSLTDAGLLQCLSYVNYGVQFVAKTPFACSKIEILDEQPLYEQDIISATKYSEDKRKEGMNILKTIRIQYRNQGLYLDQIIEKTKENLVYKEEEEYER
jgi:hypothetical protein